MQCILGIGMIFQMELMAEIRIFLESNFSLRRRFFVKLWSFHESFHHIGSSNVLKKNFAQITLVRFVRVVDLEVEYRVEHIKICQPFADRERQSWPISEYFILANDPSLILHKTMVLYLQKKLPVYFSVYLEFNIQYIPHPQYYTYACIKTNTVNILITFSR